MRVAPAVYHLHPHDSSTSPLIALPRALLHTVLFRNALSRSPEMRDRDVLGGDERHQFSRLVAARKREQDIKVTCNAFAEDYCPLKTSLECALRVCARVHASFAPATVGPRSFGAQSCLRCQGNVTATLYIWLQFPVSVLEHAPSPTPAGEGEDAAAAAELRHASSTP